MSKIFKKKGPRVPKGVDIPQDTANKWTWAIWITIIMLIMVLAFTSSTLSYYATEFTDGLVDTGAIWLIFLPVAYYIGHKRSDQTYFDRHKKFIWPSLDGMQIEDYEDVQTNPNGHYIVYTKQKRPAQVAMGQLKEKGKSRFWVETPAIVSGEGDMRVLQSAKHQELEVIKNWQKKYELKTDLCDGYRKQAKQVINDVPPALHQAMSPEHYSPIQRIEKNDLRAIDRETTLRKGGGRV